MTNVIGVPKRIKGTAVGHLTVVRCLTALRRNMTHRATALRHVVKKVQPGPLPRATYKCRLTGSKGAQVDQSATVGVRYLSFAREGGNPTVTIEASAGFLVHGESKKCPSPKGLRKIFKVEKISKSKRT